MRLSKSQHCRRRPHVTHFIGFTSTAKGPIRSMRSWNSSTSFPSLSPYSLPLPSITSGMPTDLPGGDSGQRYFAHTTPGVSQPRSNSPSPRQCSKNSVLMLEVSWGSLPSSHKISMKRTWTGCFQPSPTDQTYSTNSASSPWNIKATDLPRCWLHSEIIFVVEIRHHLRSSPQPKNVISPSFQPISIPTTPALKNHSGSHRRMLALSTCSMSSHQSIQTRKEPGTPAQNL